MSDKSIHFCGNIMLKPVNMHFSGNTGMFGFKKVRLFFHGVQNSFWFSNWYSQDCEESLKPHKKVKLFFLGKKKRFFIRKISACDNDPSNMYLYSKNEV